MRVAFSDWKYKLNKLKLFIAFPSICFSNLKPSECIKRNSFIFPPIFPPLGLLTPQQNSPPYPAGLISVREMPVTVYWITRENNWHKQDLFCYRMRDVKSILIHEASSSSNGTFARFPIYWAVRWFWLQLAWLNALVNWYVIITSCSTLWGLMGGWTKISLVSRSSNSLTFVLPFLADNLRKRFVLYTFRHFWGSKVCKWNRYLVWSQA
jgi:hypothetical protein